MLLSQATWRVGVMRASSLLAAIALFLLSSLYGRSGLAQGTQERLPTGHVISLGLYNQPVFRREASLAARALGAYYGRGGTVRVHPNQNYPAVPNSMILQILLASVPASMDKQNDVLIVFLTSHGSEQGIGIKSGKLIETL